MKKILVTSSLIISFIFSLSASADFVNHKGKVSRLLVTSGGDLIFKFDQIGGCAPAHSNFYYRLEEEHQGFEEAYALILAAAHSETVISARIDDAACSDSTISSSPILYVFQDL